MTASHKTSAAAKVQKNKNEVKVTFGGGQKITTPTAAALETLKTWLIL